MRLWTLLLLLVAAPGWAQLSKLVDLDGQSSGSASSPQGFFALNGDVYFFATDRHGRQLWRVDSVSGEAVRVTDGPSMARAEPHAVNSSSAVIAEYGYSVFSPDAGFANITLPSGLAGSRVFVFRDQYFFHSYNGQMGKLMGTTVVTVADGGFSFDVCTFEGGILSDSMPGWAWFDGQTRAVPPLLPNGLAVSQCAGHGDSVLVVKTIVNPLNPSVGLNTYFQVEKDGGVTPSSVDAGTPISVSSDNRFAVMGLATGFYLLDLHDGSTAPYGSDLPAFLGDRMFFSYSTNGTDFEPGVFSPDAGAHTLKDTNTAGSGAPAFWDFNVGERVFFNAVDKTGAQVVWSTDGSEANTVSLGLSPFYRYGFYRSRTEAAAGARFAAFSIQLDGGENELGVSDGTPSGTRAVDLTPGTSASNPQPFGAQPRRLFVFENPADAAVWVTSVDVIDGGVVRWLSGDGTSAGVATVRENQALVSWATADAGREPWFIPSADGGAPALADLEPGPGSSSPLNFTALGDQTLFTATTRAMGREVWITDGTLERTRVVRDLRSGPPSSSPTGLVRLGTQVLFIADDGTSGTELWRTDGTEAGTTLVRDLAPGPASSHPTALIVGDALAWFTADDGTGPRLWKTDGTAAGTTACDTPGTAPIAKAASGARVLFTFVDGATRALGVTDGSASGTVTLLSLGQAALVQSVATDSHWYFATVDADQRTVWATDGTVIGTHALWTGALVRESWLLPVGEGIAFPAVSDAGDELWLGDGADAGLLADVTPGRLSSWPGPPVQVGTRLIFAATSEDDDRELWMYRLPAALDNTAPRVTGHVIGMQHDGWYTGPTSISFEVSDPDSPLTTLSGCDGGEVLDEGKLTFTCRATSMGGTSQQTLTVLRDTAPPRVTCPTDLSTEDASDAGADVRFDVTVVDQVDPTPQLIVEPPAGHFPPGTSFVRATARDTAGFESSCSFRVTIAPPGEVVLPPTTKLKPSSCGCNEVDGFSILAIVALALRRRGTSALHRDRQAT